MKKSILFLSLLLMTLDQSPLVAALNFGALETPLVDVVASYFCQNQEGPVCSALTNNIDSEGGNAADTSTSTTTTSTTTTISESSSTDPTFGDFLIATGCDLGLVPRDYCKSAGEYDEKVDKKDRENGMVENTSVVDGQILGLLCGEDGYDDVPDEVCDALVGKEGNAGLVRSFCEAGQIIPPDICAMVGIGNGNNGSTTGTSYTAPSVNGGGRKRSLRH